MNNNKYIKDNYFMSDTDRNLREKLGLDDKLTSRDKQIRIFLRSYYDNLMKTVEDYKKINKVYIFNENDISVLKAIEKLTTSEHIPI